MGWGAVSLVRWRPATLPVSFRWVSFRSVVFRWVVFRPVGFRWASYHQALFRRVLWATGVRVVEVGA